MTSNTVSKFGPPLRWPLWVPSRICLVLVSGPPTALPPRTPRSTALSLWLALSGPSVPPFLSRGSSGRHPRPAIAAMGPLPRHLRADGTPSHFLGLAGLLSVYRAFRRNLIGTSSSMSVEDR